MKRIGHIKVSDMLFLIKIGCCCLLVFWVTSCAVVNHVTTEVMERPEQSFPLLISVQSCMDRTGTEVINLGEQATETFEEELNATREFSVVSRGNYILFCEVTSFAPGNAVKRWIWPGWGTTVGQVSAMLQDAKTGEVLIIIEGRATVGGGGLYSVGSWSSIVPTAVKDTVRQLQECVGGRPADNDSDRDKQK